MSFKIETIKLSKAQIETFLKKLTMKYEYYTQKNFVSHLESDTNFEATAIVSTTDEVTKEILTEKLSSFVNTHAQQASSQSPEGFTVLFDSKTPFGLGSSRIQKLESGFKDPLNSTWLEISDPMEFQKRLPPTLNSTEKRLEIEHVQKGRASLGDKRISIDDLQNLSLHIFVNTVNRLKAQENSFTKRSKKFNRDKFYLLLEGKEQEICNIFFQCIFATYEASEMENIKGQIPLSYLMNNFIHQIYFDVCQFKPFERDQMEHFLRQIIEDFLQPQTFDENYNRIPAFDEDPRFLKEFNNKRRAPSNSILIEPYFHLGKSKPINLQDKKTTISDYDILVLQFNNKLLCEDHFFTWDRHQVLPSAFPPESQSITSTIKIKLNDQVQPIPKISQIPCSNTHKSDIQVQTINYQQSQKFLINSSFIKALIKPENWKWILQEENNSIGWPHIPSTTIHQILEEANKLNKVILKKDLKPQALYINTLNMKFKLSKITQYLLDLFSRYNIPIYFQESLDFRGRSSPKGLFTPLNNKLVRHALLYSFDKKLSLNQTGIKQLCGQVHAILGGEKEVNYDLIYDKIKDYIIRNTSKEKYFRHQDLIKYLLDHKDQVKTKQKLDQLAVRNRTGPEQVIFMDASSSGSQILAMISNNKNLAIITNTYKNIHHDKAQDPYTKMVENTKIKQPRALLKDFIMTASYNAGKRSLIIKIQEHIRCSIQQADEYYNDIYLQQMSQIKAPTIFVEYLRNLDLHSEKNHKDQESYAQNTELPLMEIKYGYCKQEDIRIAFYPNKDEQEDPKKRIRFSLKSPMFLNGSDLERIKGAQAANLVQGLDATLKVQILKQFQKDNLPITCQHEAFGTHPNQAPQLIQSQNLGLCALGYQKQFESFNTWLSLHNEIEIEALKTNPFGFPKGKLQKNLKDKVNFRKQLPPNISIRGSQKINNPKSILKMIL